MPIRKSAVPHDKAFQVHRIERAARLELVDPVPATPTDADTAPDATEKRLGVDKGEPGWDRRDPQEPVRPDEQPASGTMPTPEEKAVESLTATPAPSDPEPAKTAPAPVAARRRAAAEEAQATDTDESVILKMTIRHPAPGASPTFDDLVEAHGPRIAFRLVMRQALADYGKAVEIGKVTSTAPDYPESETTIDTNRVFPKAAYAKAARHLNRSGLLSKRMIATAIGRHALAAFIRADRRA